jgi:hypothetical protein
MVDVVICYGNTKPDDLHMAARIVAIDADIIAVLERRQQRRSKRTFFNATTAGGGNHAASSMAAGADRHRAREGGS